MNQISEPIAQENRMTRAVVDYLAAWEAGRRPNRQEFLAQHADIADALAECLDGLDFIRSAAPALRDSTPPATQGDVVQPEGPLGDFRIVRELGRGGMGIVYEAVQISLGRRVALKVLPFASTLDPKQLQRFKNEAQAAAGLHHTNIVPVFATGCERSVHFYAMQFIEGQTLAQLIAGLRNGERGCVSAPSAAEGRGARAGRRELKIEDKASKEKASPDDPTPTGPYAAEEPDNIHAPEAITYKPTDTALSSVALSPRPRFADSQFFRTVANLGIQAAEALEHAHQLGVIHRDIKPANLMVETTSPLSPGGRGDGGEGAAHSPLATHPSPLRLWITDFGLAHCQGSCELTMSGDLLGTLRYMSPEQALAKRVIVDERTDIYSLGATLYELMTLEPAFPGTDRQEILRQIAFDDPKPPRKFNKTIPMELETIVLKAMEKNPADRYGAAKEVAQDLKHFLDDKPIRARRPTPVQRFRKWTRRHPGVVRTGVTAFLLSVMILAASTGLILFQLHRAELAEKDQRQARQDAEVAEGKATKSLEEAQRAEREKTQKLWQEKLARAAASRLSQHSGQCFDSLKVLAEAAQIARDLKMPEENFLQLRNEAIACLAMPDLREAEGERAWVVASVGMGWDVIYSRLDFDGSLERYVKVDENGNVSVRRLADDKEIYHFASGIGPASPQIAPDGRFLAMSAAAATAIWKLTGQKAELVLRMALPRGCKIAFSTDSQRLAIYRPNGSLHLYELPSARLLKELAVDASANSLAFNPQKAQLAVGCSRRLQVIDLESGQLAAEFPHDSSGVCWNPDGKTLAAVSDWSNIYLWDVPSRKQIGRLECTHGDIFLAFNHAGDLLASMGWDGMLQLWDPRTGQRLVRSHSRIPFLRFSRDDRLLGPNVLDFKLQFWEIHANREYRRLALDPILGRWYRGCTMSPDGRLLAVGMWEGFGLWDLTNGSLLSFVPVPGGRPLVSFESSGALLTGGDYNQPATNLGLYRWPAFGESGSASLRRFGPPQRIEIPASTPHQTAANWTEWGMAIARARGGFTLDPSPNWLVVPRPHTGTKLIAALSRDGRWIAAGTDTTGFNYEELKVWDAKSGQLVKDLGLCPYFDHAEPGAYLAFSPDSQWLANGGYDDVRVWQVGSWRERAHFKVRRAAPVSFSPDSKMLAFEAGSGTIWLVDPATGREFAHLQNPNESEAWWIEFSPDGTHLVTINRPGEPVHVWNLRAIREQLASMGLDWDLPAYPPAAINLDSKPLQVEVDPGDLIDRERYSLVIAFFPFHAEAYFQRGLANTRFFHWEQALSDFTMAASLRPDHVETHYQSGLMHLHQGQSQKAIADFSRATELRPKYAEAYSGRGEAYVAAKQWNSAVEDFSQALENKDDDAKLWFGRGIAYSNLADWQKASLDFSKAIELDPDWYEPWHGRAIAYYWRGEWQKALVDCSKALELAPWRANCWLERGKTYAALGKWQEAITDFDRAIGIRPRYLEAYVARGGAYCTMNNWEKSMADLSKALQLAPDRPEYSHHIALAQLAVGDVAGYRSACAAMLERFGQPDKPEDANWVAWTLTLAPDAVKDLDRPMKLAEGALRSDPRNHNYSQTLGAILYRAGRFTEAVKRLEQTKSDWEQSPNKPSVFSPAYSWFFLAMAHSRLGHIREAGQWLDKALKWVQQELQEGHGCPWNQRLTLELLRREAEALVKGTAEVPPTAKKEKPEGEVPES